MKFWEVTENGHKPLDKLYCPYCNARGVKSEMILRWSQINQHDDIAMELFYRRVDEEKSKYLLKIFDEVQMPSWVNDMRWKCEVCDCTNVFGVPLTQEDAMKIIEHRKGNNRFVPVEDWWENEIIKDRLRNLGY